MTIAEACKYPIQAAIDEYRSHIPGLKKLIRMKHKPEDNEAQLAFTRGKIAELEQIIC